MNSTPIPTPYDIVPIAPVAYSLTAGDWLLVGLALTALILLSNWLVTTKSIVSLNTVASLTLEQLELLRTSPTADDAKLNALIRRYLSTSASSSERSLTDVMSLSASELEVWRSSPTCSLAENELALVLIELENKRFSLSAFSVEDFKEAVQHCLQIVRGIRDEELASVTKKNQQRGGS